MEREIDLILVIQPGSEVHEPVESRPEVNTKNGLQNLESEAVGDVKPVIYNTFGPVMILDVDECVNSSCIEEPNQTATTPDVETDFSEEAMVKITGPKEKVQKCKGRKARRNRVQKSTYLKRSKKCTDTTKAEQRSEGEGTDTCVKSVGRSLFKATLRHHVKNSSTSNPCSPDTIHTCRVCGGVFQQLDSFRKHILEHKKLQRCEVCGKYFRFASTFSRHILLCKTKEKNQKTVSTSGEASPKPHRCRYCGKHVSPEHLKQHIKKHKGDRPLRCDICGQTFVYYSELRRHRLAHSSERKYPCTECGKSFKRRDNLKQHVIMHSNERPYKCPTCEKAFSRPHTLRAHMHTHHGKKL